MRTLFSMMIVAALPVGAMAAPVGKLTVTSTAFSTHQPIPPEYTCDGAQASPPLAWSAVPNNARSVAILVEDPDAPGGAFTHWLVTGLAPETQQLTVGAALPAGATASKNGKGELGYRGPCPDSGQHRYHFHVYALETTIPAPASKDDFLASIKGHVLAEGELIATYKKVASPPKSR